MQDNQSQQNDEHSLAQVIVIRADFGGGPYAWDFGCIADAVNGFQGSGYAVSAALEEDFCNWVSKFESHFLSPDHDWAVPDWNLGFDWEWFNRTGIELTRRLKGEIGEQTRVIYQKAYEDPTKDLFYYEDVEVLLDGSLKTIRGLLGSSPHRMNE